MFSSFEENEQEISLECAIIKTCKSIEKNQVAMSNVLNVEIEKLKLIVELIKEEKIDFYECDGILREINSLIKSLISYECIIENKLDTVSRVYNDFI